MPTTLRLSAESGPAARRSPFGSAPHHPRILGLCCAVSLLLAGGLVPAFAAQLPGLPSDETERAWYTAFMARFNAEAFATATGVERVEGSWFDTPRRRRQLEEELTKQRQRGATLAPGEGPGLAETDDGPAFADSMGTVGAVALDRAGHLAAATSTGGTTNKLPGRVGDTPLVGAGTWADDATCAVSGTGKGEQFIRHAAAARVAMLMSYGGRTLEQASREVIEQVLSPRDGGLIAIGRDGSVSTPFSTESMTRGVADASGRFEVATAPASR